MTTQHLKSSCCDASIIHYGKKRRQCTQCKRTWSVRPKRRGRKRSRVPINLIGNYFTHDIANVRALARRRNWGHDRAQRTLIRSLEQYVASHKNDWLRLLPLPSPLIVIADGLWHRIHGERVTVYMIFLRPVESPTAIICPPFIVMGHEDRIGWEQAFARIPEAMLFRIGALICDGHVALIALGRKRGWHIQRCHFHLIANLQMYLGERRSPKSLAMLAVVRKLITTSNKEKSKHILREVRGMVRETKSRGIRRVLRGLCTNYRDFQTHLRYPKLCLPHTTNAAESCMSDLRALLRRCRGFRSIEAMRRWITGLICWKETIQCNGKHQQK